MLLVASKMSRLKKKKISRSNIYCYFLFSSFLNQCLLLQLHLNISEKAFEGAVHKSNPLEECHRKQIQVPNILQSSY